MYCHTWTISPVQSEPKRESLKRIIPITPIWRRYQALRAAPQQERLAEAQRLVQHPDELANEFAASVAHFGSYSNIEDHFYPTERVKRDYADEIARTNDVVLRLAAQKQLVPEDAPDRLMEHHAGASVTAVPAPLLACEYVDRELLIQRTTSPAEWEDGSRNIGGLRLDVLLADLVDRTPIVGELKLPGDKDPFFALVQAMACAAHLATFKQYERMRRHLRRGKFLELDTAPRVDIWVLSLHSPGHHAGLAPKGRYMAQLQTAAETLAPRLLAQNGIRRYIRRIAGLDLRPNYPDAVTCEVRWAWAGQPTEAR